MTAVERWQRNQSPLMGKLSITSPLLLVLALTVIQGCSAISGKVTSLPPPEILSPPKGTTVHIGNASWYGPGFNGKTTASGSAFDETKLTAAHRTLPLGSKAKVTNLNNGKSVEVEINDRGPYAEGRIIDLSQAAAKALGIVDHGIARVSVESIVETSVSSDNSKKP
jgi:rare lipoprotein A